MYTSFQILILLSENSAIPESKTFWKILFASPLSNGFVCAFVNPPSSTNIIIKPSSVFITAANDSSPTGKNFPSIFSLSELT